jgi:hypothetical protein
MGAKQKAAVVAAALTTLASALAITMIVGREVRLVELIGLFAGGFGAGASVVAAAVAIRSAGTDRRAAGEAPTVESPPRGA